MSLMQGRGGIPHVFRLDVPTVGRKHMLPFICNYLMLRVEYGTQNHCRMYFTQADFDNDENFVLVVPPTGNQTSGEWHGPVEANAVWFKALVDVSSIEFVAFQRRG